MKTFNNHIYLLTASIIIVVFANSCSKSTREPTLASTPSVVAASPPVDAGANPGIINILNTSIVLHVNSTAQLTAKVYNSNGTPVSPQPSVNWVSNNTANANVNNSGLITANALGSTQITVSDGVRSNGIVNVSVVPDTTAISTGGSNISFDPFYLSLKVNSQAAIPSYTVTNSSGNVVAATPSFEIDNLTGTSLNGNSIVTGNSTGAGVLRAKLNGQYLSGSLPVIVYSTQSTDTVRSIYFADNFPLTFNYYNQTAPAIRLFIAESLYYPNGGFGVSWYTAAPDKVTVQYPKVVSVSANGQLTSQFPGYSPVSLGYKNATPLTVNTYVNVDFSGSWGATVSGTNYNFCVSQQAPLIVIGQPDPLNPINKAPINMNAANYVGNGTQSSPYNYCIISGGGIGQPANGYLANEAVYGVINVSGSTSSDRYGLGWEGSLTKLKMTLSNGTSVDLVNGAGNCSPVINSTSLTGQILESKIWNQNTCLTNHWQSGLPATYQFKADGTCIVISSGETVTGTWSLSNNALTVNLISSNDPGDTVNPGTTDVFYVSMFTATAISFSKITTYETANPSNSVTALPSQAGCTPGFQ